MTYTPSNPPAQQLRHRCRSPGCRSKLPTPVENAHAAFCTPGCWAQFHRQHCVVCEKPFKRVTESQLTCGRRKCRSELRKWRALYTPFSLKTSHPTSAVFTPLGSAYSTGLKTRLTGDRPWRIVAGPDLPEINLRIPLEPQQVARLTRTHADYIARRRKAKRHADRKAQIKRRTPPVNILGGYRFPNAPTVSLSLIGPVKPMVSPEWSAVSHWAPTGAGADMPDIPHFLRRGSGQAPAPTIIVIAWENEISKFETQGSNR